MFQYPEKVKNPRSAPFTKTAAAGQAFPDVPAVTEGLAVRSLRAERETSAIGRGASRLLLMPRLPLDSAQGKKARPTKRSRFFPAGLSAALPRCSKTPRQPDRGPKARRRGRPQRKGEPHRLPPVKGGATRRVKKKQMPHTAIRKKAAGFGMIRARSDGATTPARHPSVRRAVRRCTQLNAAPRNQLPGTD